MLFRKIHRNSKIFDAATVGPLDLNGSLSSDDRHFIWALNFRTENAFRDNNESLSLLF
jgi:hypothetical protein